MSRLVNWTLKHIHRPSREPRDRGESHHDDHTIGISSLSNELVLAIFALMDDMTLHSMAVASRRCYELATDTLLFRHGITPSASSISCQNSEALSALCLSTALPPGRVPMDRFEYIETTHPKTNQKDIRRITALLKSLNCGHDPWIRSLGLNFGGDIISRPVGWTMAGLAPKLLRAVCGNSEESRNAVFFVGDGVFTCKATTFLRSWSPSIRAPHTQIHLHDGTSQTVPRIRRITTLHATYPVISGEPWARVVVDEARITTLVLSIKLQSAEWAAILADVTLPNLKSVEIRKRTGGSQPSFINKFLNRHSLKRIIFMSPNSSSSHGENSRLNQPTLEQLTALTHYVDYVLPLDSSRETTLDALTHVELHPDNHLRVALTKLSTHAPLTNLTLSAFDPEHLPGVAWPIFPTLSTLTFILLRLAPIPTTAHRVSTLLAHSFPVLLRLEISFDPSNTAPTNDLDANAIASGSKWRVAGPSEMLNANEFATALMRLREDGESRIAEYVVEEEVFRI
ncbi:hypothetical protein C8F01DRAFT_1266077 [Mycena amicta]|nr:hypothetical protein C8F01DRAFT_1266077 [Mycena amicta]